MKTKTQSLHSYGVLIIGILMLISLATVLPGSVHSSSAVRITPSYLDRLYRQNIRLFKMSRSDSAVIIFSRGTLQRTEDLEKVHEAGMNSFVNLLRSHIDERIQALNQRFKNNPISSAERISTVIPPIYERISLKISAMASGEDASTEKWTALGESIRKLRTRVDKQVKSPGTRFPPVNR